MDQHHCDVDPGRGRLTTASAVLVVMAVLVLGSLWGTPAGAQTRARSLVPTAASLPDPGSAEADFVARINQLRASKGLGRLSVDVELTTESRKWAATMASQGRIFHAGDLSVGVSSNWQKLGENVGVGGDVATLFQAFVDSPSHYDNLIDPVFTRVGVGVVVSGNRIFTTHRFMALAAPPPPPPPPPPAVPPPPPPPPPPPTVPPTTAAPATTSTTTAPPTTAPATTTTTPARTHKLGPLERIAELIARTDST